ncbi:hypothetical protein GCM10007385_24190 [Tateyamaria omphalii]|uniref:GNAT family N-acetyltransferase n=1 Tax=Tateyamaria omphalii TaxID=299262 RepID=UPI001674BBCF|nr:GNAT family N-acetyltransferase [Tateyamaria omphalii]GGX54960.1 hypothetical protein GCM10007385_24190 [Tateyamaria omphalii]
MSEFKITVATESVLDNVESLVADATREPFSHSDLTPEQLKENEWVVSIAKSTCLAALGQTDRVLFVATVDARLVGFVLALRKTGDIPEIDWLIVAPECHGSGVAHALMTRALNWIGSGEPIKLGVIHYNHRAIAFYEKFGFRNTGEIAGRHKIPRLLMMRDGSPI